MGSGRHAVLLADAGFSTFGVDIKPDAVRTAVRRAADRALVIHAWCADLTIYPLPTRAFALVLVTRYLQRDLFPSIRHAVAPGGFVMYETFTVKQRALGTGPTSPDHLLEPGELKARFDTPSGAGKTAEFDVLFYEEVSGPEAVARIVARRTSSS